MFGGLFKSIGKLAKGVLGLDTGEDLGKQYEAQLRAQQEANKLAAANESQNVAQFDETKTQDTFTGTTDSRKKKRNAGAYANALNLQV